VPSSLIQNSSSQNLKRLYTSLTIVRSVALSRESWRAIVRSIKHYIPLRHSVVNWLLVHPLQSIMHPWALSILAAYHHKKQCHCNNLHLQLITHLYGSIGNVNKSCDLLLIISLRAKREFRSLLFKYSCIQHLHTTHGLCTKRRNYRIPKLS
jgi:hypothetical protein